MRIMGLVFFFGLFTNVSLETWSGHSVMLHVHCKQAAQCTFYNWSVLVLFINVISVITHDHRLDYVIIQAEWIFSL